MKIELNGIRGWEREDMLTFLYKETKMDCLLGREIISSVDTFLTKGESFPEVKTLILGGTFNVVTVYNTVKEIRKPLIVTLGGVTKKSVMAVNFTAMRVSRLSDTLAELPKETRYLGDAYGRFTFKLDAIEAIIEKYYAMLKVEKAEAAKRRRQAEESAQRAYEFTLNMVENHCWK